MEGYTAIKMNKLLIHISTWINLKKKMLSGKTSEANNYILNNTIYKKFKDKSKTNL